MCNTWHLICKDCGVWDNVDSLSGCSWHPKCRGCDIIDVCKQDKLQKKLVGVRNERTKIL